MTHKLTPAKPVNATGLPLPKDVLGDALANELRVHQRKIATHMVKAVASILVVATSLQRVKELLSPFGSTAFGAYLQSLNISRSHGYQLLRVAERFADYPSSLTDRFCVTSLMVLANSGNDNAIDEATKLAEGGQRISVADAKAIVAKHRETSPRKGSFAVKISAGDLATVVVHCKSGADVSALSTAIELVIAQHLADAKGGSA